MKIVSIISDQFKVIYISLLSNPYMSTTAEACNPGNADVQVLYMEWHSLIASVPHWHWWMGTRDAKYLAKQKLFCMMKNYLAPNTKGRTMEKHC